MNKPNPDRWKQRSNNFQKALNELNEATSQEKLNKLEKQGLIKCFEYTFELAWKTLQDYLQCIGVRDIVGPRPVIMETFKMGLISDGPKWLEMLEDRNQTSHIYDESIVLNIVTNITDKHIHLLNALNNKLKTL